MSDDQKESEPLLPAEGAECDKAKGDKKNKPRGKHNPKNTNTPDQQDVPGPSSSGDDVIPDAETRDLNIQNVDQSSVMSSSKNSDKTPLVSGEDIEALGNNGETTDRNNKSVSGKNTQVSGMSRDSNNPPSQKNAEETTGTPRSTHERRTEKERCTRCTKKWKTGSVQLVALGVVILAIVVSIMVINWAKLIFNKCTSENMVLWALFVFSLIGLFSIIGLIAARFLKDRYKHNSKGIPFLKIKLISMNIFGVGFMFHCGLYFWKHSIDVKCAKDNKEIGQTYNMLSIIYTLFLFVYFSLFYKREYQNSFVENLFSLGILLANSCIWLDTLFSESDFLFKINDVNDTLIGANITNETMAEIHRVSEAIETTDPFLSPAMIEFSLMAIDLLFTKTDDFNGGLFPVHSSTCTYNKNTLNNHKCTCFLIQGQTTKEQKIPKCCFFFKQLLRRSCQVIFSLLAFALFAFTFTVLITTDSAHDLTNNSGDYDAYVWLQVILKSMMLCLVLVCVLIEWQCLTFHFNVTAFVLIITCFGNVVYHMFYCFALTTQNKDTTITASWADNIISILLAGFQTLFILGVHSPTEYKDCMFQLEQWFHNNFLYYACFFLGVLNLGLWVSDSIGEERLPVFSYALYKAYDMEVWSVINKIVLPLTIFFRFHSGLDFLEIYWKYKNSLNEILKEENQEQQNMQSPTIEQTSLKTLNGET